MQPDGENLFCTECGSRIDVPALFCDMCGTPVVVSPATAPGIEVPAAYPAPVPATAAASNSAASAGRPVSSSAAPTDLSPDADWKPLAIRIGIPIGVVLLAVALDLSGNKNAETALFLLLPAMIGAVVGAIDLAPVNAVFTSINNWTVRNLAAHKGGSGKRHRFLIKPWHWLLSKANSATGLIDNPSVRNGVTVAAFLYLLGLVVLLVYIAVAIVVTVVLIVIVFWLIAFFSAGEVPSFGRGSSPEPAGGGLFGTKCATCGSRNHATSGCPHGLLSTKCGACGSTEHATSDCPHGVFSTKCGACGSTAHATKDCPHGVFSTKCGACGSTEHATSDCPHGVFSIKCGVCGSKDHATGACPH